MIKTSDVVSLVVLAIVGVASSLAQGQSYPRKPIRVVVGFSAGGGVDMAARTIAEYLTEALGQSVIVDNRAGATGNIGANLVAQAAPDGYTLLMGNSTLSTPSLFINLPFDVSKDLVPITLVSITPEVLAANPSVPVDSVKDLIALAKAKPKQVRFGSSGFGNTDHLIAELFNTMAGTEMVHVPYEGSANSIIGLISAEVQILMTSIASTLPHIKSGKVKAIAVCTLQRQRVLPNVPTIDEAGVSGFEAVGWNGLFAPAGTPTNVLGLLSKEVMKIMRVPKVQASFAIRGTEPVGNTREEFAKFFREEQVKWVKVIKTAGLKPH